MGTAHLAGVLRLGRNAPKNRGALNLAQDVSSINFLRSASGGLLSSRYGSRGIHLIGYPAAGASFPEEPGGRPTRPLPVEQLDNLDKVAGCAIGNAATVDADRPPRLSGNLRLEYGGRGRMRGLFGSTCSFTGDHIWLFPAGPNPCKVRQLRRVIPSVPRLKFPLSRGRRCRWTAARPADLGPC